MSHPSVVWVQLLQADLVTEPSTSKIEENQQELKDGASLMGSLVADLAKE